MPVDDKIRFLFGQIRALEDELQDLLTERQARLNFELRGKRVAFEKSVRQTHRRMRQGLLAWIGESTVRNTVSAPFIYALIVPFVLLDAFVTTYQAICFRLYRIPRVPRSRYIIIDRHRLAYLNLLEKVNCVYCGYGNGLIAYTREISARTEQYWCPIKHARRVADHHAYYGDFVDFGDPEELHARFAELRERLIQLERDHAA